MRLSTPTLPAQVLPEAMTRPATARSGFAAATKNQFVSFFQGKGFRCAEDAQQQLKATYSRLTVRLAMSDPQVAFDQGYAIYYLSIAPLNRCYKIVVSSVDESKKQEKRNGGKFYYLRSLFPGYGKQKKKGSPVQELTSAQQVNSANTFSYTLLENLSTKTSTTFMQSTTTFCSFEDLLKTIFPKALSFAGTRVLNSFFSLMFL